jgi:tetratricopeptide (TPR) repeat protein
MFGTKEKEMEFEEGDVFYSFFEKKYHLYKLLRVDKENSTYHVLSYADLDVLPNADAINTLEVHIYHIPIDKDGFENPTLFSKQKVIANNLIGYHEYLRQTQDIEFVIKTAQEYYKRGGQFTDLKKHELAIDEYSKAFDLFPQFFEAIDNRAFCKMDIGRWTDAIGDFEISLTVNPNSLLAEFSIGECYLRLQDGDKAKEHFENAIKIDPTHEASHNFLKKAVELSGSK